MKSVQNRDDASLGLIVLTGCQNVEKHTAVSEAASPPSAIQVCIDRI